MSWTVTKEFSFEAAHSLPHLPPEHKCHRLHGHSYKVVVHCEGDLDGDKSWVVDYAEISAAIEPLIRQLDHTNLNETLSMPHSTAENLAFWFYMKLRDALPVSAIEVLETEKTNVIYRPSK